MQVAIVTLTPRSARARPVAPRTAPSATATRVPASPVRGGEPAPATSAATDPVWRVRPTDGAETEGARTALRGKLGCRAADLLALTAAERAACEAALGRDAENARTYAVISPKLKKVFDKAFECPKGDVWCEYRIGKAPYPGLFAPRKPPRDKSWDGN